MKLELPAISILVIHHNRISHAINAVNSIKRLGLASIEYILADDGSPQLDIERLRPHFDSIVISCKNKGLGHNMNQAILLSRGKYLLVMQEDTEFIGSTNDLLLATAALDEYEDIEMVRFYNSKIIDLYRDAVSIQLVYNNTTEIYVINHKSPLFKGNAYSDMPHLRRNPSTQLGAWMYLEERRMELVEKDYSDRFAEGEQRVAFLFPSRDLVVHCGELVSYRTNQWDYRLSRQLIRICQAIGIDTKHPILSPIRKLLILLLPHARITYKD
jgi:glycosyltransferase involved in cell wall biosynthesis